MTPGMTVRLLMCAATGDVAPTSILRWLPEGTLVHQVNAIGDVWRTGDHARAWDQAWDLVDGPSVLGWRDPADTRAMSFSLSPNPH